MLWKQYDAGYRRDEVLEVLGDNPLETTPPETTPTENIPGGKPLAPTRGPDPNRPTTWVLTITLTDPRGGELSENWQN